LPKKIAAHNLRFMNMYDAPYNLISMNAAAVAGAAALVAA
tara:strand:+ start:163 stop:282 length:120 start_codon:yes stop_codon:yes gene_type:complete